MGDTFPHGCWVDLVLCIMSLLDLLWWRTIQLAGMKWMVCFKLDAVMLTIDVFCVSVLVEEIHIVQGGQHASLVYAQNKSFM